MWLGLEGAWRAEIELPLRRDDPSLEQSPFCVAKGGRHVWIPPSPLVLSMLMLVASVGTTASGCYFCRLPTVTSRHPLASSRRPGLAPRYPRFSARARANARSSGSLDVSYLSVLVAKNDGRVEYEYSKCEVKKNHGEKSGTGWS